ncbi:MAG: type III-B CRISPR module RAMP protein Cmr1 [Desulfurococcaceae archaeon]|nr:type III-B CRISPR module RAMP protein Cmr1 [Desulfurococcaceae archaeon]
MSKELVIEVQNSTPLLVGWYDPLKQDVVGLRPTEIKGLWRWWARAFIAGALYDLGLLSGEEGIDVVLRPTKDSTTTISYFVGKILGLGYVGMMGESEASRFTLYVEGSVKPTLLHDRLQRIRLLTIKRRVEGVDVGQKFKIIVRRRVSKYSEAEDLAIKILVLALQLSGIGKGSRRGLGSLDILSEPFSTTKNIKSLIKDVYDGCREVVERYRGYVRTSSRSKELECPNFPPLPLISKGSIYGVNISQILRVKNVGFEALHNFFIRSERCRVLYGSHIRSDEIRNHLVAWFLGLPRQQRGTGYMDKISRRASPIILSYHSSKNFFGDGGLITTLVSGDWPRKLLWRGTSSKYINIDCRAIVNAFNIVSNEYNQYLRKLNGVVEVIWP